MAIKRILKEDWKYFCKSLMVALQGEFVVDAFSSG